MWYVSLLYLLSEAIVSEKQSTIQISPDLFSVAGGELNSKARLERQARELPWAHLAATLD